MPESRDLLWSDASCRYLPSEPHTQIVVIVGLRCPIFDPCQSLGIPMTFGIDLTIMQNPPSMSYVFSIPSEPGRLYVQ
jgi:hypothetical protein